VDHQQDSNEYYVSMTDMMVGVIFVFIIMVSYFVLQLQKNLEEQERNIDEKENYRSKVEERKTQLVTALAEALRLAGIEVTENPVMGVVNLEGDGLFNPGSSDLSAREDALEKVNVLALTLHDTLGCFSFYRSGNGPTPLPQWESCNEDSVFIDSIYVEGHSDSADFTGVLSDGSRNNLQLSARRATNTYEQLVSFQSELTSFLSPDDQQALSVAAYGDQRPVESNDSPEGRAQNRRIAIRLVMYMPGTSDNLENFMRRLEFLR
jgi:chemotaxis protein MotB